MESARQEATAGAAGYAPPPNVINGRAEEAEAADAIYDEHHSSSGGTVVDEGLGAQDEKHEKRTAPDSSNSSFIAELGGGNGVSVRRGKEEFAALERKYSNMSQHSQDLQRTTTGLSMRSARSAFGGRPKRTTTHQSAVTTTSGSADVEKGQSGEKEFNLADELRAGREQMDASDIKHKLVGVVWEDLEVIGAGGMRMNIRNFSNAVIEQFLMPALTVMGLFGYNPFAPKPKTILHKNSGVLKPGEMCLVLGRPGSGCSTFLKSISNQRESFLEVDGNVEYAGLGWKEMHKLYAGEVSMNA